MTETLPRARMRVKVDETRGVLNHGFLHLVSFVIE